MVIHIVERDMSSSRAAAAAAHEAASLRALKEGLSDIPHGERAAFAHVRRVAPALADDAHLLAFLRGEDFDVPVALKKLVTYWSRRHKIFGPEKYTLPMTLDGAMRDTLQVLRQGYVTLLPVRDEYSRPIIYFRKKNFGQMPSTDEKLRSLWYLLHIVMQDPVAQRKGYVILTNSKGAYVGGHDTRFSSQALPLTECAFPVCLKAVHACHSFGSFPLVARAVRHLSGLRGRTWRMHNGTDERVLEALSEHGLSKRCIPSDLGGTVQVATDMFLQDRLAIEGGTLYSNGGFPSSQDDSRSNRNAEHEMPGRNPDHCATTNTELKAMAGPSLTRDRQEQPRPRGIHAETFATEKATTNTELKATAGPSLTCDRQEQPRPRGIHAETFAVENATTNTELKATAGPSLTFDRQERPRPRGIHTETFAVENSLILPASADPADLCPSIDAGHAQSAQNLPVSKENAPIGLAERLNEFPRAENGRSRIFVGENQLASPVQGSAPANTHHSIEAGCALSVSNLPDGKGTAPIIPEQRTSELPRLKTSHARSFIPEAPFASPAQGLAPAHMHNTVKHKRTSPSPSAAPEPSEPKRKPANHPRAGCEDPSAVAGPRGKRTKPGRIGDPRMNRAVRAKLDDPSLTMTDALLAGGFVFPGLYRPEAQGGIAATVDEEGVTMYQRRNQLMRRLRKKAKVA